MPPDYPVEQMMMDIMAVVQDNMPYIVPAAIFSAVVAFTMQWFFHSVDIATWTFGRKK